MITVGYSTREHNPTFIEYLKKSSGFKKLEVIEKINNGEKSLAQVYNEILEEANTDIVILCHDDIYFEATGWYNKILKHFEKSDFGIIGMAGSTSMPSSGQWWEDRKKMVGIVNHESGGKKWESKYSESFHNNVFETIIVDGLFMAINKKRIKSNFIEDFKGFHFYDIPFCFENYLQGVKVGVITNIRVTHKSIGQTNEQWEENRKLFAEKYKSNLPVKLPFDSSRRIKVLLS
jgi:glycosyltransferase involved in cell wall biosynthesis